MKKLFNFILAITVITLFGCFGCETNPKFDFPEGMELLIIPGEYWHSNMKFLFFNTKKSPQMAAWVENDAGNYVSTILITSRSAKKNWISSPKEGRPEALPVWNHRHQENVSIDTVTTATPKGGIEARINKELFTEGNTYTVYFEINHSFDYNNHWTKNNSGDNGQPSVIYQALFTAGQPFHTALTPIGYGSVDGSNGNITIGLENLTTALNIVKNVYITGE